MNDRVVCRVGMALAVASLLTLSQSAHAQEVVVAASPDETVVEQKPREPLYLALDFNLGFGDYANVGAELPQPPNFQQQWLLDTTQIRTATFMLEAHYQFRKFGIGF